MAGFKKKIERRFDDLAAKIKDDHAKLVQEMLRVTEMTSKQMTNFMNQQYRVYQKSPEMTQESLNNYGTLANTTDQHSTSKIFGAERAISEANQLLK